MFLCMTFISKVPTLSNKGKNNYYLQLYSSCKRHLLLNNLVALNKLYKTLIASVDEINGQQNTSPSIYYFCMSFVYYHQNQQLT